MLGYAFASVEFRIISAFYASQTHPARRGAPPHEIGGQTTRRNVPQTAQPPEDRRKIALARPRNVAKTPSPAHLGYICRDVV